MKPKKKWLFWAILVGVIYYAMSYHFIIIDSTVRMLKKSRRSFNYTFFSAKAKTNEAILSVDELREDGIADLLVEMGKMTEEEKEKLMAKFE